MKTVKFWLRNARSGSLVQSLMPSAVAVIFSIGAGFSLPLALLALLGVAAAHLCFNLLDDYFDYRSHETGYRDTLARAGFRAYTAKCPYLTDGSATMAGLRRAIAAFGALALLCGGVILYFRGLPVLVIVLVTALLGVFYSGAPLRLSYHRLGEAVIGVIFGPLNVMGTALAACGRLERVTVLVGIVFGLLVTNILYSHSVLDYAADQSVNKQTLAAVFHSDTGRLRCSGFLVFMPYVLTVLAVAFRLLSPWYLLTLASVPLAAELYRSMKAFRDDPKAPVVWKKWYGKPPMDWSGVQAAGLDWFLQRWLLSRNLVAVEAVCWIVSNLVWRLTI